MILLFSNTSQFHIQSHIQKHYSVARIQRSMDHCTSFSSRDYKNIDNETLNLVVRHLDCLQKVRDRIQPCIEELTSICQAADLRVIKSTRVTMPTIVKLLEDLPKMRVIQIMRDPRAVAQSRHHHPSYYGLYSKGDLVLEADLYCRNVMLDNAFVMKLRSVKVLAQ